MGYKGLFFVFLAIGLSSAQISKVCVPTSDSIRCQNLDKDGSQVSCEPVSTRVECAARLVRGAADFGVFSDEELLLLAQQSNDLRVVATVRDVNRQEPYSFEAVVVVPNNHTNGFAGLRNGRYCHPGFGVADIRWSPRVLRAMEVAAARTDRCEGDVGSRTAEEMEVTTLSNFFSEACRPGPWSANATLDANLKSRFPNLCAMCSAPGVCAGYDTSAAVSVAGVLNSNRHIQALDCLTTNGTVAFVAWQHVREFFTLRSPQFAATHSILCEDGSLVPLTTEALNTPLSPCSLVKQPWSAVVARSAVAETVASNLRTWWPTGADFGASSWQTNLFAVLAGGANWNLVHETNLVSPANYTGAIRNIPSIDSAPSCLPARRWCTVSTLEQTKCTWVRNAAHSLGIQPPISCQQRASVFDCLDDIRESRSDFFSVDSHYGYIARRHYNLSPVKLVQNSRGASSRVATLIKSSAAENITRFENLRDRVACFPEYGSIAYVAFLRAAQDRGVISSTQCNYQRAVGEFFSGACAPGALHHSHTISDASDCNYQRAVGEFFSGACAPGALHHSHTISDASDVGEKKPPRPYCHKSKEKGCLVKRGKQFDATTLCTACRPNLSVLNGTDVSNFTCAFNSSNLFFGNQGSVSCLASEHTDVAVVELQNIDAQLRALNIDGTRFRALCSNNTLALFPGTNIDDGCLIAHVVDAEVLTRRNDPIFNSINVFLDAIDEHFGYNAVSEQLINMHIYDPFDGTSDLLFKDSTVGLTEPNVFVSHQPARNYINLFTHLEACTSAATTPTPGIIPGVNGLANRNIMSVMTMAVMGLMARFVVY